MDPFHQNVTFHDARGQAFEVSVDDIDEFIQYGIKICINYGAQIGGSVILLVVLLLLTKPEKRKSPIFYLNAFALLFNIGRMICMCLYFTGGFSEVYAYFADDYSRVSDADYADSIVGLVMTMLLLICVEASLVMQTHIICNTLKKLYRRAILAFSLVIALLAIGFRLALVVKNSQFIMAAKDFSPYIWLQSATNIVVTISICFFCLIFVIKLGFAIRQRRRLGLTRFGPMQVIFIMGCQTMILPSICSVMQYFTTIPEMSSNALTLVAISLPLSSIWASATLNQSQERSESGMHQKLFNSSVSSSSSPEKSVSTANSHFTRVTTQGGQSSVHPILYPDLERGNGIRVDRDFIVSK